MSTVIDDPLTGGREAFAAQQWQRAYELLKAADAQQPLPAADLDRLVDAACWTRRYDEMLDLLERAEAAYERDGDRRGAARTAIRLTQEHYQRNHDAQTGAWMTRAVKLLEGEPDCHENGMLLWLQVRALLFMANDARAALEKARELVDLARRLGDLDLEALGPARPGPCADHRRAGQGGISPARRGHRAGDDGRHGALHRRDGLLRDDLRLPQHRRLAARIGVDRRVAALVRPQLGQRLSGSVSPAPG